MSTTRPIEPETYRFTDDGSIPNNPRLPLLVYRGAIDLIGTPTPEAAIEKVFRANGWGGLWRNGIYLYVHYHSAIHESMGVARGRAIVRFGGNAGTAIELASGDVAALPAGTGHQCLQASPDLMVIGAYPNSGRYNLCRGSKEEHAAALRLIPRVPPPESDPVFGVDGPMSRLWRD